MPHEPIYVNLSGEYVIPANGQKPQVGSITGDLRLAELDAFLHALRGAYSEEPQKSVFNEALCALIGQYKNGARLTSDGLTLKITSTLKPESNEISYTFSLKG